MVYYWGGVTMREEIKAYMQKTKSCTTREVADAMGISVYQAQYYLAKLHEKGEIVRSEKRQGQRCIWTIK
ncbi:TPA: FaeA/PapI family transcriptional regulator [Escherichia coli]